ncbi:basic helix-loop-helix (bHLH) DNA-bindingsuperfamily protein [Striga asiatica]|uniref:Basic helix-loop-helix (BHLH) DNA-bindingsuperfamily protein n=1 Tax=Striga asiatica TaxID=4170 RepID=A0A5A7Q2X7_STRAF|nr:basic helix-loop-helix (bHLH) DNA-bindingsuperfamily protein [Striga asiatica]
MFNSETMSPRDMSQISDGGGRGGFSLPNPANLNNFKHASSAQKADFDGSNFFRNQNQLNQPGGGLARFKSAPSSFLAALIDSNNTDNSSSGDDESEAFFSALMSGPTPTARDLNRTDGNSGCDDNTHNNHQMFQHEEEKVGTRPGRNGSGCGHMGYESAVSSGGGCIVGSYSVGMEESQVTNNMRLLNKGNISSNLVRQSSSPAGFFNGFDVTTEAIVHSQAHAISSTNGMSTHLNFSSPSVQCIGTHNLENEQLRNGNNANLREFEAAFPHGSWNDSSFGNSLKRNRDGEMRVFMDFNGLDNQNTGESSKGLSSLVHHLSLPRSAENVKFLQFQPETVPCQVRAKRGCATHPRSIAERMRRSRISEKMKKLQDLFPNMDKQTSTADMLDLAVGYIKDLQKQVQTLTDKKTKCICSSKPQQV